jgi:hypothetical protein
MVSGIYRNIDIETNVDEAEKEKLFVLTIIFAIIKTSHYRKKLAMPLSKRMQ